MRTRSLVTTSISAAGAGAAGAALMYLWDPDRGRRRRAIIRDKVVHLLRRSGRIVGKTSREISNRAHGVLSEAQTRVFLGTDPDNDVVAERVRSKIGRYVSHPGALEVTAENGVATLRGDVLRSEVGDLMRHVYSVRDVKHVVNELKVHAEEEGIPGFQGGATSEHSTRLGSIGRSPALRITLGALGSALAIYATANRRSVKRIFL